MPISLLSDLLCFLARPPPPFLSLKQASWEISGDNSGEFTTKREKVPGVRQLSLLRFRLAVSRRAKAPGQAAHFWRLDSFLTTVVFFLFFFLLLFLFFGWEKILSKKLRLFSSLKIVQAKLTLWSAPFPLQPASRVRFLWVQPLLSEFSGLNLISSKLKLANRWVSCFIRFKQKCIIVIIRRHFFGFVSAKVYSWQTFRTGKA